VMIPRRRSPTDRQGIEFDYLLLHASFALRADGFGQRWMVNSNPEPSSTDYEHQRRLYFEPLTIETVLNVIESGGPEKGLIVPVFRRPDHPLKLALPLPALAWPTPEGLGPGHQAVGHLT